MAELNYSEIYEQYKKASKNLKFLENDIKEILTNIENGRYTDEELLLEYKNLKALHKMKIEKERIVNEKKKALSDYFLRSIGYKKI